MSLVCRSALLIQFLGTFAYKEKAWLVLWEAGLIIELPPGVLLFYPSSLFVHFNVDITGAYWCAFDNAAR